MTRITKQARLRTALAELCAEVTPGTLLPSERQLCDDYHVSRMTVREVLGQLESDGIVVRIPGKGTFVAEKVARSRLHMASFTADMRRLGLTPSTVVLHTAHDAPPPVTTAALRLAAGDKALHAVRLRLADDVPMSVDDAWYPAAVAPGLLERDLTGSVYALLEYDYASPVDRAEQTIRAIAADQRQAEWLRTDPGAPMLRFDRVAYSGDTPVEHCRSWYRADRYQVAMTVLNTSFLHTE